MRHFRRFNHSQKLCVAILAAIASACGASAQSPQQLQPSWNDAVSTLADKIAGSVSPAHPVALTLKNSSSLESGDADSVRTALESQLAQHHIRVTRAASAETQIDVTLSESTGNYVWVAALHTKDDSAEPDVAVVSVPKSSAGALASTGAALTLQKALVWQQPAKFLDFRESTATPGSTSDTLEVLEPARVAFYTRSAGKWSLEREAPLQHRLPWPRDVRGNLADPTTEIFATISGVTCTNGTNAPSVQCVGTPLTSDAAKSSVIPGRETGEAVALKLTCGDAQTALASGNGDWTQPDTLRGYLLRKKSATASGAALDFDGPVLSLASGADGEARVIVLNLKTGNYEGYSVSATCGQ
jgi:hypothetical protein